MEFFIARGAQKIGSVETASIDDFYYLRDSIHNALEDGEFGSRFPVFLCRFEPDEWKVDELDSLRRELETIVEAFKRLPPEPFDSHWESRAAGSGASYANLYEVFIDAGGQPILGRLLDLCRMAERMEAPINLR
ncbi:MAG: hypothetical protein FJZ38_06420 [Candidatus Rokubacteria bacterium]|nr:hypothetical protein [Candidatus Rokubacteria bacterium]